MQVCTHCFEVIVSISKHHLPKCFSARCQDGSVLFKKNQAHSRTQDILPTYTMDLILHWTYAPVPKLLQSWLCKSTTSSSSAQGKPGCLKLTDGILLQDIFIKALRAPFLLTWFNLTHRGWVTHMCASKLTAIGSDNGFLDRRQAIIWTKATILLILTLWTNLSEILSEIHTFSLKKMYLKTSCT